MFQIILWWRTVATVPRETISIGFTHSLAKQVAIIIHNQQLTRQISENKATNRFHSVLLILAMAALLSVVGFMLLGGFGFVLAIGLTIGSVFFARRVSLAMVMRVYKARVIKQHEAPALFESFIRLYKKSGLSHQPTLLYVPTRMPNAFATGHGKNSAVAVTDGLVRMMNLRELEGIIGHELAHLMHRDTKVMSLADSMSRLVSTACRLGFFMLLMSGFASIFGSGGGLRVLLAFAVMFFSPTLMVLLQLALSRSREFNADLGAVQLTGDALGLASALNKLERISSGGSFWQKILRPGGRRAQPAMLRTHPPTEERVNRLMEHAGQEPIARPRISPTPQPRRVQVEMPRVRPRPRYRVMTGLWH